MHELVYASDLLISLAGRSTIGEANVYHIPAIFIPIRNHFRVMLGAWLLILISIDLTILYLNTLM